MPDLAVDMGELLEPLKTAEDLPVECLEMLADPLNVTWK